MLIVLNYKLCHTLFYQDIKHDQRSKPNQYKNTTMLPIIIEYEPRLKSKRGITLLISDKTVEPWNQKNRGIKMNTKIDENKINT